MALSVNLLATNEQCDAIIATIDDRLRVITKRESDFDYQRDNATDAATNVSARLTRLASKITELTDALAAQRHGPDEHRRTDADLTDAQYEQKKLTFRQADRGPMYLVLREVDVDIDSIAPQPWIMSSNELKDLLRQCLGFRAQHLPRSN